MATYTASNINDPVFSASDGCAGIITGKVTATANVDTGDILRFARIPPGFEVHAIVVQNADLGTTVPGDIGYNFTDGSTGDSSTAFASAYAFGTASANGTYIVLSTPVIVEKEAYLEATLGTVSTGTTGAAAVQLHGRYLGAK